MEEWIRFELLLKVLWFVVMEVFLIGMKLLFLLIGVECGFIKLIVMFKLVLIR